MDMGMDATWMYIQYDGVEHGWIAASHCCLMCDEGVAKVSEVRRLEVSCQELAGVDPAQDVALTTSRPT